MPYSVVPAVVESSNSMTASMISLMQSEVARCLTDKQIDKTVDSQVTQDIHRKLEGCAEPLKKLSARKKQDSFFDRHALAVTPQPVYFQYVPVKKTIWSLMQNKSYVEALL